MKDQPLTLEEIRNLSYHAPTVEAWKAKLSGAELADLIIEFCDLKKRRSCEIREVYLAQQKGEIGFFR